MALAIEEYSKEVVWRELLRVLMKDEPLGRGCYRQVFPLRNDPEKVVKVEERDGNFSNVLEWRVWQEVIGTKFEKFFAPCIDISPNGVVLVQARTSPLHPGEYPKDIPSFMSDFKPANFGRYKGRIVCHDYALNLLISHGVHGARIKPLPKYARDRFLS